MRPCGRHTGWFSPVLTGPTRVTILRARLQIFHWQTSRHGICCLKDGSPAPARGGPAPSQARLGGPRRHPPGPGMFIWLILRSDSQSDGSGPRPVLGWVSAFIVSHVPGVPDSDGASNIATTRVPKLRNGRKRGRPGRWKRHPAQIEL